MSDQQIPLEIGMVLHILEQERYPTRFEDLCVDLFEEIDGCEYVRTSRTYDRGRDGRGAKRRASSLYIICGTDDKPVKKASDDMDVILKRSRPKEVLCCFTDPHFTEDKAVKIEAALRDKHPMLEVVRSFGGEQIAQLLVRHPDVFEKYYLGELNNLRNALALTSPTSHGVELTGLRIALTTQLHDDAQDRRRDLVHNLILTALSVGVRMSIRQIARQVSDQLRLPRMVSEAWLQLGLNELMKGKLICQTPDGFEITTLGLDEIRRRTSAGTEVFVRGQNAVRKLLHELTGIEPSRDEFQFVWKVLEGALVSMFLSHGAHIVESVVAIALGHSEISEHDEFRSHVDAIAAQIGSAPGHGDRISEVAQAIRDMFYEKTSDAFQWLVDVAEVFLHLCALGLEPQSQAQIIERLREIELFLDTDIILSLLSTGEPNHEALVTLVRGWKDLGGQIFVTDAALEEASHHAWIAQRDFEEVGKFLDSYDLVTARHMSGNVFVRGFHFESKVSGEKCTKRRWEYYISAFIGDNHHDWKPLLELLEEHGVERFGEEDADHQVGERISKILFADRQGASHVDARSLQATREKCDRDGRTGALIVRRRKELAVTSGLAVVVSASRALRRAVQLAADSQDIDEPVWYVGAVAWLLGQVPGAKLSASTLRAVLFDVEFPVHLDRLERQGLRILHASEQFKIHYSRRPSLRRAMRSEIRKQASARGIPSEEVERELFSTEGAAVERAASLIAKAADSITRSQAEEEIARLQAEIRRLKGEV
jgi:hypothetical protein